MIDFVDLTKKSARRRFLKTKAALEFRGRRMPVQRSTAWAVHPYDCPRMSTVVPSSARVAYLTNSWATLRSQRRARLSIRAAMRFTNHQPPHFDQRI